MRLRVPPALLGGDRPLVRRVPESEEQADGDRLGVDVGERLERERGDDPVGPDPLAHADAALERDERLRLVDLEAVEMSAVLAAQIEEVLEPLGRHERGARALPLEQGVRGHGRAVGEPLDPRVTRGLQHEPGGLDDGLLLRGVGRHFRGVEQSVGEQHGVRERPADVDAERRHQPVFRSAAAIPAIERSSGRSASGSPARCRSRSSTWIAFIGST